MFKYNFYYDESEHSRKINYKTVSASNYYDNFVTMIVGWSAEKDDILQQHAAFETKYADRKDRNGEIKSTVLHQKQFKYGFSTLNKQNAQLVNDFLSLFDKDIHIYFSVSSKIEYLVLQIFQRYRNSFLVDADLMKYSITKALVMYRPKEIIKCLYESPKDFLVELKKFFRDRIECNRNNPKLKQKETEAFQQILFILDDISDAPEIDWDYHMPFDGFRKYLEEEKIADYFLTLDKEGDAEQDSKTLQAAHLMGLQNTTEVDSLSSCGVRMADMMAGIMTKLLKSLCDSLRYHSPEEGVQKKVLAARWFQMNEAQLGLYKKLYKIICEWDHAWYKSYAGIYSDDLVTFIALLNYMNHFESVKQIHDEGMKAGVTLNPATPVSLLSDIIDELDIVMLMSVNPGFGGQKFIEHTLEKVRQLRSMITSREAHALIEVDGGVNEQTGALLRQAGTDVLVAGSAVFNAPDPLAAIQMLKSL